MKSAQVRQKFVEFYRKRGHVLIPSAPLVPENDLTTLFTGSGMQPMLPYLLGLPHPSGSRIVDAQKCLRVQDIEEVGNNRHTTFFEMLGNWSLGDYFKKEQIEWLWMFLTDKKIGIGLDPNRLYVSVFRGKSEINIPKDEEAAAIWKQRFQSAKVEAKTVDMAETRGMQGGHIFYYDEKKNWWSRAGVTVNMPIGEPGGPDSEVFFDFGENLRTHENSIYKDEQCHPNCDCGRFLEICNSVFMTYRKTDKGFIQLEKKNIDFGGGLERMVAAVNDESDIFRSDLFISIIRIIETFTDRSYEDETNRPAMRVIADHLKAATFSIKDGVVPSNKTQGYVLRRLLRRAAVKMHELCGGLTSIPAFNSICDGVMRLYDGVYFDRGVDREKAFSIIENELTKFSKALDRGLQEFNTWSDQQFNALNAFNLFQSYGFPYEITDELFRKKGRQLDKNEFERIYREHQELSRTTAVRMFQGGLADHSEIVTKLHTATHLLHAALRQVLGTHVEQKGSNITVKRLRFDFTHSTKLTEDQRKEIEAWVNEQILHNLPVSMHTTTLEKAKQEHALAFFTERYSEQVQVYSIGSEKTGIVSKEVCGGPHVPHTGRLGSFHLGKEESVGTGTRRLYATLT